MLSTIRRRLILLIFAITAAAVGFVYLYVVPQIESSLTAEKLRRLERLSDDRTTELRTLLNQRAPDAAIRREVDRIAQLSEARVTLLAVRTVGGVPRPAFVLADSAGEASAGEGAFTVARAALDAGAAATGVERLSGARNAASATPIPDGARPDWVAELSIPLAEVDDNVSLIRRQILIAGVIAIGLAGFAGFIASGPVSRRLGRLRMAAERITRGDFDQPIPLESDDELGELARAFNEMQAQLARLDTARKEFIANASHEFRTPIFSLGGFVELLDEENPPAADRRRFVSEMRVQVKRLEKLTIDLLDLSRIDADALDISTAVVDLTEVARDITREFRPRARKQATEMDVRHRGEVLAQADQGRTEQILRILLDNALVHTPEQTKVTVTTVREGQLSKLIVADDGRGIEPRAAGRVFERFYNSDDSPGSGLGLAIAAEMVELMDGEIELDSRRGFTAFTVSLPAAKTSSKSAGTRT